MLSETLQTPELSSIEGQEIATLAVKSLQHVHLDLDLDLFWGKVELRRAKFDIEEPQPPRKCKVPKH